MSAGGGGDGPVLVSLPRWTFKAYGEKPKPLEQVKDECRGLLNRKYGVGYAGRPETDSKRAEITSETQLCFAQRGYHAGYTETRNVCFRNCDQPSDKPFVRANPDGTPPD